jgi:AcrR family transcriptional regulator
MGGVGIAAEGKRRRHDPRRESTRVALIEAAESLIAEHGAEAVSTRQIGAAIGALNTNVVAYHFGGKDALIEAVYRHRLPEIDRRRSELLAEAERRGEGESLRALIGVLALPWFEQVDPEGRHSFAGFIAAVERGGLIALRGGIVDEFPESSRVTRRIASSLPSTAGGQFGSRLRLATAMILSALQMIDREAPGDPARRRELFEDCLDMAAGALAAPAAQERNQR